MSKVKRYVESIHRFIKDKSCLLDDKLLPDKDIGTKIHNKLKDSNLILPIVLLTVMNSQNRKNSLNVPGYYAASSVEFLNTVVKLTENRTEVISEYDISTYHSMINYLTVSANRSLRQNLETVKNSLKNDKATAKIYVSVNKILDDNLTYSKLLGEHKLKFCEHSLDEPRMFKDRQDVVKWWIKDDKELIAKFDSLKRIKRESFDNFCSVTTCSLCELAMCTGWLIGCGEEKKLKKIKKAAKYFSNFYKVSTDIQNVKKDLKTTKNYSTNFAINYGLQNAYEFFMDNMQKFIEEALNLDIYSNTFIEIVHSVEASVDKVIDETSPDIKSSYSSSASSKKSTGKTGGKRVKQLQQLN